MGTDESGDAGLLRPFGNTAKTRARKATGKAPHKKIKKITKNNRATNNTNIKKNTSNNRLLN